MNPTVRLDIEKAFCEAAGAAAFIMRAAIEHEAIVKSETGMDNILAVMAKSLVQRVAKTALRPLYDYDAADAAREAWLQKYDLDQAQRQADGRIHDPDCACDSCSWQRHDDAMYAKAIADKRVHLDEARAMVPDVPSTPWPSRRRAEQHVAQSNPPAVISDDVTKALEAADFVFGETDEQGLAHWINRDLGHEVVVHESGEWIMRSGWTHAVTAGETVSDLQQALEKEENWPWKTTRRRGTQSRTSMSIESTAWIVPPPAEGSCCSRIVMARRRSRRPVIWPASTRSSS